MKTGPSPPREGVSVLVPVTRLPDKTKRERRYVFSQRRRKRIVPCSKKGSKTTKDVRRGTARVHVVYGGGRNVPVSVEEPSGAPRGSDDNFRAHRGARNYVFHYAERALWNTYPSTGRPAVRTCGVYRADTG